jgi:hypothetical protein
VYVGGKYARHFVGYDYTDQGWGDERAKAESDARRFAAVLEAGDYRLHEIRSDDERSTVAAKISYAHGIN